MLGRETGGEDIFGDGKTGLENLDLEVALLGGREPVADNLAGTFTFKTVSPVCAGASDMTCLRNDGKKRDEKPFSLRICLRWQGDAHFHKTVLISVSVKK